MCTRTECKAKCNVLCTSAAINVTSWYQGIATGYSCMFVFPSMRACSCCLPFLTCCHVRGVLLQSYSQATFVPCTEAIFAYKVFYFEVWTQFSEEKMRWQFCYRFYARLIWCYTCTWCLLRTHPLPSTKLCTAHSDGCGTNRLYILSEYNISCTQSFLGFALLNFHQCDIHAQKGTFKQTNSVPLSL